MDRRAELSTVVTAIQGGRPVRIFVFIIIAAAIIALVGWEAYQRGWLNGYG